MKPLKIKNFVAVLLVGFILASCMPAAVVPTESAIFSPTITVTPLPTETSTPNYTPTPTPIPQVWLDSVRKVNGKTAPILNGSKLGDEWIIEGNGWIIDGVIFDPATLGGFSPDDGIKLDDPRNANDPLIDPRFGSDGVSQVHLRCYGEITLPNGSKVITGFLWFQQTFQPRLQDGIPTWEGINYSLGLGLTGGTEASGGSGPCQTLFTRYLNEGKYDTSFVLVFMEQIGTDIPYRDDVLTSLFTPLLSELTPPDEFWRTGDISLLPKVNEKPFLLATHFGFEQNK
jgi:hypothetical protein